MAWGTTAEDLKGVMGDARRRKRARMKNTDRINPKKSMPGHILFRLSKTENKKILKNLDGEKEYLIYSGKLFE